MFRSDGSGAGGLGLFVVLAVFGCVAAAIALPHFLGPEAESRAEMILRTPVATPAPTPDPAVVAAEVETAVETEQAARTLVWGLVVLGLGIGAAIAVRVWAKSLAVAKAARALPAWDVLPDRRPVMVSLPEGETVYDPRFGSVTVLPQGHQAPCLEQGDLVLNQQNAVAAAIAALLQVPLSQRSGAWQAQARHYGLLEETVDAQ